MLHKALAFLFLPVFPLVACSWDAVYRVIIHRCHQRSIAWECVHFLVGIVLLLLVLILHLVNEFLLQVWKFVLDGMRWPWGALLLQLKRIVTRLNFKVVLRWVLVSHWFVALSRKELCTHHLVLIENAFKELLCRLMKLLLKRLVLHRLLNSVWLMMPSCSLLLQRTIVAHAREIVVKAIVRALA